MRINSRVTRNDKEYEIVDILNTVISGEPRVIYLYKCVTKGHKGNLKAKTEKDFLEKFSKK